MPHLRKQLQVSVDLDTVPSKRLWRITHLSVASTTRVKPPRVHTETVPGTFSNAGAALDEAKRRARQIVAKHFGSIPDDEIVWKIIPPEKDCPDVSSESKTRNHAV